MIVWGLCGLMYLPEASPKARALWVALEAAVRESRLTDWNEDVVQRRGARAHAHLAAL